MHRTIDIDALLAFHRANFGDARMEDDPAAVEKAAADKAAADKVTADTAAAEKAKADEALGDAGKQAIDRMKAERNAAKDEAKAARDELAALKAKTDGKEAEHAAEKAQRDRDAAALAKVDERILKAEVRAAAAGKLSDPADALKFLDLSKLEVGSDGEVDGDAVTAAIDDLIKTKPYLAVQDGKRFQGGADGGTRNESKAGQLSEADVKRLTAEKRYDEIETARQEGRLTNLLAGK